MSTANDSLELIGLLDRIGRSYPGGIPSASICTPQASPQASNVSQPMACVLISLGALSGASAASDKLAQAICEKGLRLSLQSCSIRHWNEETIDDNELGVIIAETLAAVVIVCGEQESNRGAKDLNGTLVLRSYALREVAANVDIKRRFWDDLKLVMPRLQALRSAGQS